MRNFKSKAVCLLSSAVLLCGASGMTANAATNYSFTATSRPTITAMTVSEYYLDKTDIEIESDKTAVINAKKSSSFTLPANSTVSYQWYKNGSALSGETRSSLTVSSAGTYYCEVKVKEEITIYVSVSRKRTGYRTKTYTTGNAKVAEKLVITKQPTGGTFDNSKGYFDMFVSVKGGTGSYTYKWYWNGKETALTGTGMRVYGAGTGYCVITDSNGKTVTTQNATVSYAQFKITSQPTGGYFDYKNGYYDMYVSVTGGRAPYTYKWYWNGKETSLTGNGMRVYNEGTGYCVITDANGNKVTSNSAKVVYAPFNAHYEDYGYFDAAGSLQMMDLTVTAAGGTGTYTYNWQKKVNGKWEDIGVYTGKEATYTVSSFDIIDNEEYKFMFKRDDMYIYSASFYDSYRCIVGYTDSTGYHTRTLDEIKVYSKGQISHWWPIPNVPM
ncbi:immunoglobulin domain-containing protein [Ruminococcus flavefaciens]|uniref:immunoglobulin domain-containing protein n=1 Tax=Ruminococcus flavefaciens TaxID=1265 RepID=UPI00049037B1|nr:immunoglobulin domain-containing protein [Ruminococcus flavefaciens]